MKQVYKESFICSILAVIYIALVALLLNNGEKIFGKADTLFSAIAFLLLFVLSALVMSVLLIGKPLILYLDGEKKSAINMVIVSAGYLILYLIIALAVSALVK